MVISGDQRRRGQSASECSHQAVRTARAQQSPPCCSRPAVLPGTPLPLRRSWRCCLSIRERRWIGRRCTSSSRCCKAARRCAQRARRCLPCCDALIVRALASKMKVCACNLCVRCCGFNAHARSKWRWNEGGVCALFTTCAAAHVARCARRPLPRIRTWRLQCALHASGRQTPFSKNPRRSRVLAFTRAVQMGTNKQDQGSFLRERERERVSVGGRDERRGRRAPLMGAPPPPQPPKSSRPTDFLHPQAARFLYVWLCVRLSLCRFSLFRNVRRQNVPP